MTVAPPETHEPAPPEAVLVTGFPAFTAARMVRKIVDADPEAAVFLLARDKLHGNAEAFVARLPEPARARVRIVVGDVCDMDLGLAGAEVRELADQVTTIHHLAGLYHVGVERAVAERVNVEGTRGVIDFAAECRRLRRLCHWSTASVSGRRKGVILEEELDEGQPFSNFWEETKFEAEKLARAAARRLPVTVFRPGIIVGDSRTGEIDKFDGPYSLIALIVEDPLGLALPLLGRGAAPLHVVPIDFVVDAALALAADERAAGMTFHLTDPNPFSARQVHALVAERAHKKKPPSTFLPIGLARAVMRTPGLERLTRAPLSFLESLDHLTFYNCRNTVARLAGTGIVCPPFDSYADVLVRHAKAAGVARRKERDEDVFDPFE